MSRKTIAKDILNFCKEKNMRYFTTKYEVGKVINSKNNKPYNSHEIANGTRYLKNHGLIKRISKNRWEVID